MRFDCWAFCWTFTFDQSSVIAIVFTSAVSLFSHLKAQALERTAIFHQGQVEIFFLWNQFWAIALICSICQWAFALNCSFLLLLMSKLVTHCESMNTNSKIASNRSFLLMGNCSSLLPKNIWKWQKAAISCCPKQSHDCVSGVAAWSHYRSTLLCETSHDRWTLSLSLVVIVWDGVTQTAWHSKTLPTLFVLPVPRRSQPLDHSPNTGLVFFFVPPTNFNHKRFATAGRLIGVDLSTIILLGCHSRGQFTCWHEIKIPSKVFALVN